MALLQLGYWNIRGLAAPLRMMLCFRDVQFENKTYQVNEEFDRNVWLVDAKPALKEKNALMNLPYIVDGDTVVCQSNACFSYLGRKLHLWGNTDTEITHCEELLCEAMDLRNHVVDFSYGRAGNPADKQETVLFLANQEGILAKLELWLTRQPDFKPETPFFVSDHATAPDFHIFELLSQLNLLAKCRDLPLLTDDHYANIFPSLRVFYQQFKKLPENAKYFSSIMENAPCNNLMAVFGSMPQGQRWQKGMALPEDISGVY